MSKTTVEYKLYLYAEQPAAGQGFSCSSESYATLAEARAAQRARKFEQGYPQPLFSTGLLSLRRPYPKRSIRKCPVL